MRKETQIAWPAPSLSRGAGVLLHPTSLPTAYGIGDLGPAAYAFVDDLVRARVGWWQILPLGPTGYGDSPYACFSAFAGNTLLLSPEVLMAEGLLTQLDVAGAAFPEDRVDYGHVVPFKDSLLHRAWEHFQSRPPAALADAFAAFCHEQADWLEDYVLFRGLKEHFPGKGYWEWAPPLVKREPSALADARRDLAAVLQRHRFAQFLFHRQWQRLRSYANERGLRLLGDVPIFVAPDSADVWSHPELFLLDEARRPTFVAGVPPDYFSRTGQLWGNPVYDWPVHARTHYDWWVRRLRATLAQVDLVRLDHFRGFEAAWHVQAGAPTAEKGTWEPGPGLGFFKAVLQALGSLPLVAEDLGEITPPVRQMLAELRLPGMRILQFAFGAGAANHFLPHNFEANTVVYTGTHDNDTTRGWYRHLDAPTKDHAKKYLGRPALGEQLAVIELLRLGWSSVAVLCVAPVQDLLELGSSARMNFPGQSQGNWTWRMSRQSAWQEAVHRLGEWNELYGRQAPVVEVAPRAEAAGDSAARSQE